jgi:hypothetical protein
VQACGSDDVPGDRLTTAYHRISPAPVAHLVAPWSGDILPRFAPASSRLESGDRLPHDQDNRRPGRRGSVTSAYGRFALARKEARRADVWHPEAHYVDKNCPAP